MSYLMRSRRFVLRVLLAAAFCTPPGAMAQWKPEKNVEFVIGTGPGGVLDRTARHLQRIWSEGGIVPAKTLVVNKPGGGQSIALGYLKQQAGDGHYLSVASGIILSNHITGKSPHAYTEFTPVAILFGEASVFAINPASSITTADELMARLRKDPYTPSFAVGSTLGSVTHVAAALVGRAVGADVRKMKAVVFNSSGDSVTALLGGHVDVVIAAAQLVVPHVQSNKLRVIAIASEERLPGVLAGVPTWKEQGVDAVVSNWRGVIGPKGMTAEQIGYWERALQRTIETPEWQAQAKRNLWEGSFLGSRAAKSFLDADHARMKAMLGELGLANR